MTHGIKCVLSLSTLVLAAAAVSSCSEDGETPTAPAIDTSLSRPLSSRGCNAPPARGYSRLVYDAEDEVAYLFGGFSTLGWAMDLLDVWAYDVNTKRWELRGPFEPGDYDALALDARSRKVIVYQPFAPDPGTFFRVETWAYDVDDHTWENMEPVSEQPPSRWGSRMAYDAESDRIVLFGGSDNFTGETLGDTWAYDYETNRWTNLDPDPAAPPHHYHDMVYHAGKDRIVMFGGIVVGSDAPLGDTWAFDLNANAWIELQPVASPAPRLYHTLAYEAKTEKIVMHGGVFDETDWPYEPAIGETWTFDLDRVSWEQMRPREDAGARAWHQMVGIGKDVLLFGGGPSRFEYGNDTYTYRSQNDKWKPVKACEEQEGGL